MEGNKAAGTAGGILLSLVAALDVSEIYKTCLLAMIGAIVSYSVSSALKILFSKKKKDD